MKNKNNVIIVLLVIVILILGYLAFNKNNTSQENTYGTDINTGTDNDGQESTQQTETNVTPTTQDSMQQSGQTPQIQTSSSQQSATKNYSNASAKYSVEYSSSWDVQTNSNDAYHGFFSIENNKNALKGGGGFALNPGSSMINIEVDYNMNYSSIVDFTNDPKYGLTKAQKDDLLSKTTLKNIGGKNLQVQSDTSGRYGSYRFVYNNILYKIYINSVDQTQMNKDINVFNDFVASFKLN